VGGLLKVGTSQSRALTLKRVDSRYPRSRFALGRYLPILRTAPQVADAAAAPVARLYCSQGCGHVNQTMIPSDRTAFRIGDWRIEPALDEIARDGVTAKLEPRRMRVLVCLAEHAGEVVSVEELLDAVWKDVVVTHDSVYQAVAGLRRALGDDQKNPIYIANVQRRGYRLIAPVAPAEPGQVSAPRRQPRPAFTAPATPSGQATAERATIPVAAFAPPPHSIAVLPFVNISSDKEQEYFSDGLTDELLNSLARIHELQVTGRTSAFYFKWEHADLTTIARKLNVAAILEGSVRRSEHTVRVSAQLINAFTGFGVWSDTYDRDLGDVLKVQTEIATSVASALKVTLLKGEAAKIEVGGTRNAAAFDAYLRAAKTLDSFYHVKDVQAAIAAYSEAIRLDRNYALAFAGRSLALSVPRYTLVAWTERKSKLAAAQADAQKAILLAPAMAEGHLALAGFFEGTLDLTQAIAEYERALTLGPGNARVLQVSGPFFAYMGRADAGIAAARRAVVLDPLSPHSHFSLGLALLFSRRYEEAVAASGEVLSLDPDSPQGYALRGMAYLMLGKAERAREACAVRLHWVNLIGLAIVEDRLGRHANAEAALASLKAMQGDRAAYYYAAIYAQWAKTGEALNWLETAMRLRNPTLEWLKTDPFLDPLRQEPRFQAIERELKFPE
jgi:TolB-like protein